MPILAFPMPRHCSGKPVECVTVDRRPLRADGLLIVSWDEFYYRVFLPLQASPSNHLIDIKGGQATLPVDWKLAAVILVPNDWVIGFGLGALFQGNLEALAFVPLALVPLPVPNPHERLYVLPLVPGFHPFMKGSPQDIALAATSSNDFLFWRPHGPKYYLTLLPNEVDPVGAKRYYDEVRSRLRLRGQPPRDEFGADLRLPRRQYHRAVAFVERELAGIDALLEESRKQMKEEPNQSRPAADTEIIE